MKILTISHQIPRKVGMTKFKQKTKFLLVRVVKMHFTPSFVAEFKILFNQIRSQISSFEGCNGVQLMQHETQPELFFTISNWRSADDLENYRKSELFTETWAKVKSSFASKAEAWSLLEQ